MVNSKFVGLTLAIAGLTLAVSTGCTKQEDLSIECYEDITVFANEATLTKTHINTTDLESGRVTLMWDTGDQVGTFGSRTKNSRFLVSTDGVTAALSGKVISGDILKYAYYPYDEYNRDYTAIPVYIQGSYKYEDEYSVSGMDVRATNTLSVDAYGNYYFDFKFVTSFLKIKADISGLEVHGITSSDKIAKITINNESASEHQSDSDRGHLTGNYKLDLRDLSLTNENTSASAARIAIETPNCHEAANGAYTVVAPVAPGFHKGDVVGVTILTTNGYTIYLHFTCNSDFQPGYTYTFNVTCRNATAEKHNFNVYSNI